MPTFQSAAMLWNVLAARGVAWLAGPAASTSAA